jgi:hypothetical protein
MSVQSRAVPSKLALARVRPSRLKATPLTASVWPLRRASCLRVRE